MRSIFANRLLRVAASVTLAVLAGCGQRPNPQGVPTRAEARTALIYEAELHQGPETLRAFWRDFPKGPDLHVRSPPARCMPRRTSLTPGQTDCAWIKP